MNDNVTGSPALPAESTARTTTEYVPSTRPVRSNRTVEPQDRTGTLLVQL